MYSSVCLSVCLSVSNFAQNLPNEFSGKVDNGLMNKLLNFSCDPDPRYGSGYGRIHIASLVRRALAEVCIVQVLLVTFRVSRRPREMYCAHARLSLCLSAAACPHYCTDPDVTWGSGRGCALVVHYWADLQSVHGMRCCGNIMEMRGRAQR